MNYKNISCIDTAGILGLKKGRNGNYHCFNNTGHKRNDKNPSLSISNNAFYCHACGITGNNIELIKQVLKFHEKQSFDWLKDNFNVDAQSGNNNALQAKSESQNPIKQKYIDILEVMQAQTFLDSNIFTKGLIDLGMEYEHLIKWNVGGNAKGETIFYYQDINHNFINAKRITYHNNLHRNKNIDPTYLYKKDDGYGQCLFGEHFFDNTTICLPVILVESEKTCIIASYCMPSKLWIATGGVNGLREEKAKVLKGRNVFIMFDSDMAGRSASAKVKSTLHRCNIFAKTMDPFKNESDGKDLADYLIDQLRDLQIKKSILSDNELELFEERAGVLQYQFDMSRYVAELQAFKRMEKIGYE